MRIYSLQQFILFVDGNGRTARLLMNLLLLQDNYPLVIIDVKDRKTYIHSIQKALQGDADVLHVYLYSNRRYTRSILRKHG